jgi:hypothetical protein
MNAVTGDPFSQCLICPEDENATPAQKGIDAIAFKIGLIAICALVGHICFKSGRNAGRVLRGTHIYRCPTVAFDPNSRTVQGRPIEEQDAFDKCGLVTLMVMAYSWAALSALAIGFLSYRTVTQSIDLIKAV